MKKILIILFLIGLALPALGHSQTLSGAALQAKIAELLKILESLKVQVLLLQSRPSPNFATSTFPLPPLPTPSGTSPLVISPNGGENWTIGNTRLLRWQTDYTNAAVNIWLVPSPSSGGGQIPVYSIASAAPNIGVYTWPVGRLLSGANAPTGAYRLRVCYFYPFNVCDESEGVLTLANPPAASDLNVLSPAAGEIWTRGETGEIRWQGSGGASVTLTLLSSANVAYLVSGQTPNSGSFTWRVGDTALGVLPPDGDYRLRICYFGSTVCTSTVVKLISPIGQTPSFTIISPNGGERLTRGENLTITWRAVGLDAVSLFLVHANYPNVPVRTIAVSLPAAGGAYTWTVPTALLAGSDYQIRITSAQVPAGDLSDGVFSVVVP